MLWSLFSMLNYRLAAREGVEGTVYDFLFDDESWMVHYLVAETEHPLKPGKVLILPIVLGKPDGEARRFPVRLSGQQIRNSPPLDLDLPISRQRAVGMKYPVSHLRSLRELVGYRIFTDAGHVGTFDDLIVQDTAWGIRHAVVKLQPPLQRSVLVPLDCIRSISWSGKAAWLHLPAEELLRQAPYDPCDGVNIGPDFQAYDYLGRPVCAVPSPDSPPERAARGD